MGQMLVQLLSKELPKGFVCKYVKYDEISLNRGEGFSDELIVEDLGGHRVATIQVGYILGGRLLNIMRVEGDSFFSNLSLLKLLDRWEKEFELTSNLRNIIRVDEALKAGRE